MRSGHPNHFTAQLDKPSNWGATLFNQSHSARAESQPA